MANQVANQVATVDFKQLIGGSISLDFRSKLVDRICEEFTEDEQKWFIANFYVYLQYHPTNDFPIKLDNIWGMVGFSTKANAKRTLKNNFIEDEDYKIVFIPTDEKSIGRPEEEVLLNVDTFKNLCMITKTEKSKKIRKYYIKLEGLFNTLVNEQKNEFELKLQLKEQELIYTQETHQVEKEQLRERTLIEQFIINTLCIYYGKIDNKDSKGGSLLKFGMSNNLGDRIKAHKRTYKNFRLINAIKVTNHIEIENCIKKHPQLKNRIRSLIIDDLNYRELICIDDTFTLEQFEECVKQIIEENVYNVENYKKLLQRKDQLDKELWESREEIKELKHTIEKLEKRTSEFRLDPYLERKIKGENSSETMHGYCLVAFKISDFRHRLGMCKWMGLETREQLYKSAFPDGKIVLKQKIKHPFIEKVFFYLAKRHLTFLNNDTFDGAIETISELFTTVALLEQVLINNDITNIRSILEGKTIEVIQNDPEIPIVRKAKRPIDQIDPSSGIVVASFKSIEEAGRHLGLTTGTAIGTALRNKTLCKGFLWRYSGVSPEDQMSNKSVIRICCNTGKRTFYSDIASAAKDAKISAPGLRNRILTDVHANGYHWIFQK